MRKSGSTSLLVALALVLVASVVSYAAVVSSAPLTPSQPVVSSQSVPDGSAAIGCDRRAVASKGTVDVPGTPSESMQCPECNNDHQCTGTPGHPGCCTSGIGICRANGLCLCQL